MFDVNQAISEFIHHCRYEKALSAKTIKFYSIDLKQFKLFLVESHFPDQVLDIDKSHLKEYLKHLSQWKPKTVKRKLATLKALFNFLEFEDHLPANPMRKLKIKIKEPVILPKALTLTEIKSIFHSAYGSISRANELKYAYCERVRDAIVIELLFSTGARVSEIANLRLDDINLGTGAMLIRGKGNKERYIQVCSPEALILLNQYYDLFHEKIKLSGGFLLINRFNSRLSEQSIRNMVRTVSATTASIAKKVTPHMFRHTFATLLLENDVDIKYIQSLLGHSSIITTQLYTQVNGEKQRKILRERHPRMGIKVHVDE